MPTRFDHAVIVVRDLDRAIGQFQRLGFDAGLGGRHVGRGTHNGLIRFGLDYVELLSVYDEAEARAFKGGDFALLDSLNGQAAQLVGFALATDQIEQAAERFNGHEDNASQLHAMSRIRPDGQQLSWRTLAPGGSLFKQPWPFLIQWDTPDEQRLRVEQPHEHPNGTIGWSRVSVVAHDFERTLRIYRNQLDLDLLKLDVDTGQAARRALLSVGSNVITLLAPTGDGSAQRMLAKKGEGPFALSFRVKDLAQTYRYLKQHGIAFEHITSGTARIILDPAETLGIRIYLAS